MQRRTGLVVAGALACLGALTAVTGSIDAPTVTAGTRYEVSLPWEGLVQQGEMAAGGLVRPQGGSDLVGPPSGRPPVGQLVVFSAWLLVAFRKMDALAGVFTALTGLLLAALVWVLTSGGAATGRAVPILGDLPAGTGLLILAAVVVAVSTAIALSLPERFQRPDGRAAAMPSLDRLRETVGAGSGSDRTPTREPSPSNAVEQAWWDVTRRVDRESWATRTPREVEAAAADAGLSTAAVADLRGLFEEVRYGGAPASEERRAQARELRARLDDPDGGQAGAAGDPAAEGDGEDHR